MLTELSNQIECFLSKSLQRSRHVGFSESQHRPGRPLAATRASMHRAAQAAKEALERMTALNA